MEIDLRAGVDADAEAIARVHQQSRALYYGAMLPLADPDKDRLPAWREMLRDPTVRTVVAGQGDGLVGFICMRHVESADRPAELTSLYVAPDRIGMGVGDGLYRTFLDWRAIRSGWT